MNFANGMNGFGNGSQADVDALNKALEAGHTVNPLDLEGGGAFRVNLLKTA